MKIKKRLLKYTVSFVKIKASQVRKKEQEMKKSVIKDIAKTIIFLVTAFFISVIFQVIFEIDEHVSTLFAFAIFLISLSTNGYIYGIISAFIGTLAINYAFTFPYFALNFTVPGNFLSAVVMITISFLTSTLTTEIKRQEVLKIESARERMRANLLRAVSHDLRTPLTTIYSSASALQENGDSLTPQQQKKILHGISEDAQWLVRMVENLLSITRIDSTGVSLTKTPTVLDEVIDSLILKFRKRYPHQPVSLQLPEEIVVIPMDPILIEQVLLNLLENAVQHAAGMTTLTLSVSLEGNQACFLVADDGCGIPEEALERIFTGYYDSGEKPADSQKRNMGIGLSVCATIIRAHGGTITAKSRPGGGSEFRFHLSTEDFIHE